MKKAIILLVSLLMVISCSKSPEKNITLERKSSSLFNDAVWQKFISTDTADFCKYILKKPLTEREKDSIFKASFSSTFNAKNSMNNVEGEYPEYQDYSGLIHLKVFYIYNTTKVQHPILNISVTDDYAMVGGGAYAFGYTGNGAFLTESRPLNSTTWQGQSKDHIVKDPHNLKVFAIGMRIDGVDPAYLRSKIHIMENTSDPPSDLPQTAATVPENCLLIGGGAWDNYYGFGNLLISSFPYDITWQVGGKAYRRSDPAQITAYAIGIENISYPTVGYLQTTVRQTTEIAEGGQRYCYAPVWDGYALTCPGGYCTYSW